MAPEHTRRILRVPVSRIPVASERREELLAEGFAELVEKPLDPIALCGVLRRPAQLET